MWRMTWQVLSVGPYNKVAREIVRLQRERDGAVAAAARAEAAAAEARQFATDARRIIAAAAAQAAGAADAAGPAPEGQPPNYHFHITEQPQQQQQLQRGYAAPAVDAGRHAAEVASLQLQVKVGPFRLTFG